MIQGFLHEAIEPGSKLSEHELTAWYEKEISSKIDGSIPELVSCAQYNAADEKKPSSLVVYETTSTSTSIEVLNKLRADNPVVVDRLEAYHASICEQIYDSGSTEQTRPYLMTGFMTPGQGDDEEFNQWYTQEHLGDMSKVPGWRRARRFRINDSIEKGTGKIPKAKATYAAIYELDHFDGLKSPEYHHACTTPWTAKMTGRCPVAEMRKWKLVKTWSTERTQK
ncbi:hypothetical protein BCR39DRAFT_514190 [Naematelia encephala]|uniref:EthD domain-containing protein n=1 Tax=Naematelia encephala TaxID=71784 RepID=A0A1Y2BIY1_9TREE|nr:hypothetical protein BCR39DRAFT_514190 [Naematelia encephala]